jgi:hypothetical protein
VRTSKDDELDDNEQDEPSKNSGVGKLGPDDYEEAAKDVDHHDNQEPGLHSHLKFPANFVRRVTTLNTEP